jgi:cytochrome c peroxidase
MLDGMKNLPGGLQVLPDVPIPADNPQTPAKIALGRKLFFETRLSGDGTISCATCHAPDKGFSDGLAKARGFNGKTLRRNSPTVLNAAFNTVQFWDGRAQTLEEQCKGPLMSAGEMNLVDEQRLRERLNSVPTYVKDFQEVFGSGPSLDNTAKAISAYERTLVTRGSRFDRYVRGEKNALTDEEKRGLLVFISKGSCPTCHKGPNLTDNKFHNLGIVPPKGGPEDLGRFEVTKKEEDRGAFKTPSLRNVVLTGPYMHDGSAATLEEVIDLYDRGGGNGPNKSKLIYPLNLSGEEKADLVAFLKTLTGAVPQTP